MLRASACFKKTTVSALVCLLGAAYPSTLVAEGPDCGRAPFSAPAKVAHLISGMDPVFAVFPDLRQQLTDTGLELCIAENMVEAYGYYEPENNRIVINSSLSSGLQQAILVHELRHVDQFTSGICPTPDLAMGESARAVFAMEADASATGLIVAWAMRAEGYPQMWDALAAWPMQQDIAKVFADEMQGTNDVGVAASGAFAAWYGYQPRVDLYYLAACSSYLETEDSSHRLRGYETLDPAFYDSLCQLPKGGSYACADPR